MRAALVLAALLVAVPAQAKPWQCVLWPKSCQAPVLAPAPDPPAAAVETSRTAPPVAPVLVTPSPKVVTVKAKKIRSNQGWARRVVTSKRKAALPSWCKQVPSWASVAQMQSEATKRGHVLTSQQAQACLDSKKG